MFDISDHLFCHSCPCFRRGKLQRACPVLDTGDDVWIPVFTGMTKSERTTTTVGEPLCACQPRAGAPKRRKVLTNETEK